MSFVGRAPVCPSQKRWVLFMYSSWVDTTDCQKIQGVSRVMTLAFQILRKRENMTTPGVPFLQMWSAQRHNPLILDVLHLHQEFLAGHVWWFWVLSVNPVLIYYVLMLSYSWRILFISCWVHSLHFIVTYLKVNPPALLDLFVVPHVHHHTSNWC